MCIGGLVSALWLIAFGRRVVYMHDQEITTIDGYDDLRRRRRTVAGAQRIVAVSRFSREAAADGRVVPTGDGVDPRRFCRGAATGRSAGVLRD